MAVGQKYRDTRIYRVPPKNIGKRKMNKNLWCVGGIKLKEKNIFIGTAGQSQPRVAHVGGSSQLT